MSPLVPCRKARLRYLPVPLSPALDSTPTHRTAPHPSGRRYMFMSHSRPRDTRAVARPGGRVRLRPAAAHTLDPGLSAGSCVAAEAPVVPLCRARPGPRSPCRRWGRRGAPAAGGGCGALAELRTGRGSVRPPGPRRAWAGRRGSGGAGLALPCFGRFSGLALPLDGSRAETTSGLAGTGGWRGSPAAAELAGPWSKPAGCKLRHVCESSCR